MFLVNDQHEQAVEAIQSTLAAAHVSQYLSHALSIVAISGTVDLCNVLATTALSLDSMQRARLDRRAVRVSALWQVLRTAAPSAHGVEGWSEGLIREDARGAVYCKKLQ